MLKKLPLDIQTFRKLRESDYIYVDKTQYAYNLIMTGRRYFLSRPRRFGKSLFVSTLKEILSGNKELFHDLWIMKSDYEWKPHAVVSLSLSAIDAQDVASLRTGLSRELMSLAKEYAITLETKHDDPQGMFFELIRALHKTHGSVAILIDEYDNPVLKKLNNKEMAIVFRDVLSAFFAVVKDLDALISFVFVTGVSSFSKAGIFSGLNNLKILTLDDRFGDILGYTAQEIDVYFKEYITLWSQKEQIEYEALRQQIRDWYNGYRFGNNVESVYNPFSLMNALDRQEFKNFWFQSGTPTFLIEELKHEYRALQLRIFDPESIELDEDDLGTIDVGIIPLPVLMFQTGYLTIDSYDKETKLYRLRMPNNEVKTAFQKLLLNVVAQIDSIDAHALLQQLKRALIEGDIETVVVVLKSLFIHIPYQLYSKEEKFYHAILQIIFNLAGIKSQSEYSTNQGRIDLVLDLPKIIYIIEIKFNSSAEIALAQIQEHSYYEKFLNHDKPIVLLGLSFNKKPKKFEIVYASKMLDL